MAIGIRSRIDPFRATAVVSSPGGLVAIGMLKVRSCRVYLVFSLPGLMFAAGLAESLKVYPAGSSGKAGGLNQKLAMPPWCHRRDM